MIPKISLDIAILSIYYRELPSSSHYHKLIAKETIMDNVVALLTDFGTDDGSVACMEAVILSKNPNARVIHISHTVHGWDISVATLFLEVYFEYYPPGTVFCVVVDPGVGTERKAIAVQCEKHFFVGPDNGIFTRVFEQSPPISVVELNNPKYWLEKVSTTFHGRDIFSPVAAHLALSKQLDDLGCKTFPDSLVKLKPFVDTEDNRLITRIVFIDCWGNMVIGVKQQELGKQFGYDDFVVTIKDTNINNQVQTFGDLAEKELGLIFGEDFGDYGSIAMNMGNAAQQISADLGDIVKISKK